MLFDQAAQMLTMDSHAFGRHAVNVDQFMIVAIDEIALHVEHVGESAGEPGAEVHAGASEHAYHAARHVLAAMIPRSFHHRQGAGIAYTETLEIGRAHV